MDQAETLLKIMKEKQTNNLTHSDSTTGSRIITVTSGKGGVGKTSLSTNLAIALSQMGKEVILMDADLGLANVNVMLGIIPKYNLYNVIKGQKTIKDIITDTTIGIKIIAGASGFSQLADLTHDEKTVFIKELEKLDFADIIIIDTGAGISDNVLSFVLAANEIIVVTTPEPTAITDAYGIIKSIASKNIDANIKLIINRVQNYLEASKVADRVINIAGQFLNISIDYLGYIQEDSTVSKAVVSQQPFIHVSPKSKASNCIRNISLRLEKMEIPHKEKGVTRFIKTFFNYYNK